MVTVLRSGGFRVVVYLNDHQPAHVHVIGTGEMKVNLVGPGGSPEIAWARSMSRADIRRAVGIVAENRDMLMKRWSELHGRAD